MWLAFNRQFVTRDLALIEGSCRQKSGEWLKPILLCGTQAHCDSDDDQQLRKIRMTCMAGCYSALRVRIGSMDAARRAGPKPANAQQPSKTTTAPAIVA